LACEPAMPACRRGRRRRRYADCMSWQSMTCHASCQRRAINHVAGSRSLACHVCVSSYIKTIKWCLLVSRGCTFVNRDVLLSARRTHLSLASHTHSPLSTSIGLPLCPSEILGSAQSAEEALEGSRVAAFPQHEAQTRELAKPRRVGHAACASISAACRC